MQNKWNLQPHLWAERRLWEKDGDTQLAKWMNDFLCLSATEWTEHDTKQIIVVCIYNMMDMLQLILWHFMALIAATGGGGIKNTLWLKTTG